MSVNPMIAEGVRQSDRVSLQLQVEASWFTSAGVAVRQAAQTLLVSRNGGVLRMQEKLFPGQEINLHRKLDGCPLYLSSLLAKKWALFFVKGGFYKLYVP